MPTLLSVAWSPLLRIFCVDLNRQLCAANTARNSNLLVCSPNSFHGAPKNRRHFHHAGCNALLGNAPGSFKEKKFPEFSASMKLPNKQFAYNLNFDIFIAGLARDVAREC